ncbi:Asp/Glu/hydantoin racemase [Xylariomycetidae sp. FL2044]|nr:Asp/Glu/hydantoin racemase [Xylariomycetidae sp. FL2044]
MILGLLGGMSWESTVTYYQEIDRHVRSRKGGLHSAPCITYSFDCAPIEEELQHAGKGDEAGRLLNAAAIPLQRAGAEALGTEDATGLPFLHIADPTAERIVKKGFKTIGRLGTKFTIEKYDLTVIVPDEGGRQSVHDIIYQGLRNGIIKKESREAYDSVIVELKEAGAECNMRVALFDTMRIHAIAAVEWAMKGAP